jgi:IMP dehydrogenase
VPQLTAIIEVRKASAEIPIISDGGIRTSGDIVKALAAGADAGMLGRLLASATEAAGRRYHDGTKAYRGMASQSALEDAGKDVQPEGVEMSIRCNGTVADVISDLMVGVRAGMAYVGARNLYELMSNARFVEITSNGYMEGLPKNG